MVGGRWLQVAANICMKTEMTVQATKMSTIIFSRQWMNLVMELDWTILHLHRS